MILNPIIALIRNTRLDRWHPVIFRECPLPGPSPSVIRHKSCGHHTEGFVSREAAIESIDGMIPNLLCVRLYLENEFMWDGEGIPTIIHFFAESELTSPEVKAS